MLVPNLFRLFQKTLLHQYHILRVQGLLPTDYSPRMQYSQRFKKNATNLNVVALYCRPVKLAQHDCNKLFDQYLDYFH